VDARAALAGFGWSDDWESAFAPHAASLRAARVASAIRDRATLLGEDGSIDATIAAKVRGDVAVGDWVAHARGIVQAVLPRRTAFVRGAAGAACEEQVVAANVDVVWIVSSLDRDFNVRRIERYLALARASGVVPAVVLTKTDVCANVAARIGEALTVAGDARVHAVSCKGGSVDSLRPYFAHGRAVALLGSSGVGKSTLVNRFVDAEQAVSALGAGGRGRHTTTRRELFVVPGGGVVIDTPGMREVRVASDDGLDATFDEIASLARECRFRDCAHGAEPGCAVRSAVARGDVAVERWSSFEKLRREARAFARRSDARAALEEKRQVKAIHRAMRARERFG
jgi:ribosome biogenesis GTPase